jgi:uncharacterized protein (TIGR02246 family)
MKTELAVPAAQGARAWNIKTGLAVAAACFVLQAAPAQAQQQGAADPSHAADNRQHARIEQLLTRYEQALNASDANAAVQLYTDDGVFMAPENPTAVGTKVLREAYAGVFQAIALKLKFQIAEAKLLSPEWALLRTTSTGVVKILANGAEVPGSNQELFLLRKTAGQWKIARYSFSSVLPPAK